MWDFANITLGCAKYSWRSFGWASCKSRQVHAGIHLHGSGGSGIYPFVAQRPWVYQFAKIDPGLESAFAKGKVMMQVLGSLTGGMLR